MHGQQAIDATNQLATTMSTGPAPLFTAMGAGVLLMMLVALIVAMVMRMGQNLPQLPRGT